MDKLLPFQIPHVESLIASLSRHGAALDCSDTGTGKSYCAAAITATMGLRPLIIGPKAGVANLYRVFLEFGITPLGNVNYETFINGKYYATYDDFQSERRVACPMIKITREPKRGLNGQVIPTASGRPRLVVTDIRWDLEPRTIIIFDEAHRGKNGRSSGRDTINSKLLASIRTAVSRDRQIYTLIMSASLTDKLENLDVVAFVLGLYRPYVPQVYAQFLRRHGREPAQIFKSIHQLLFPSYASRITIVDVQRISDAFRDNDVRAKVYRVDLETSRQIQEQHEIIRESLSELHHMRTGDGWGRIIRAWQKIEIFKVPSAQRLIAKHLAAGRSVLVFVNFRETERVLLEGAQASPSRVGQIHGGQSAEERGEIITRFQNDEIHLVICQIRAGGTAISLHDLHGRRQRVSLIFPTLSAIDLKQALGRIHRANAKSSAIQRIIYIKYFDSDTGLTKPAEPIKLPAIEEDSQPLSGVPIDSLTELAQVYASKEVLTIEEILCRNLNKKLTNIELFNNGHLEQLIHIGEPSQNGSE
jgi:Helicase conserved C-terminal domain